MSRGCSNLEVVKPVVRFLAIEAAGWAIGGLVLLWLAQAELMPTWLAITLFLALVAKDLALYPLTRKAYEDGVEHGAAELLGSRVRVETDLSPEGWVSSGGERWRARLSSEGSGPLREGEHANVRALSGLTLIVEPLERRES